MLYTQRIFWPSYDSDDKLTQLLDFLQNNRGICDEISFFTEGDGMDWRYMQREEIERRAKFLERAVRIARGAGFGTAINILNTIGHSDEGGEAAPDVPWQGIVGYDGAVSRNCSCPFDTDFLEYVVYKYETYARAQAGKYWIDDDVRLGSHAPVDWGCFCDKCIADFSGRVQQEYSREELVQALRCDTQVRRQWIARSNDVMKQLLAACARGVQRTDPQAEIGLMCGDVADLQDCGVDFQQWFAELSSRVSGQVWLRPGGAGGFWTDSTPRAMLFKIHAVSNTLDALPEGVLSTYEIENYPYIQGNKSASQTGLECLLVILATRIDGLMFDVLDASGNSMEPFGEWMSDLGAWRPFWEDATELVKGTVPLGWKLAYSRRHFEQHRSEDLHAMRHISYKEPHVLQLAGLPMTGFSDGALGHVLCGAAAQGMSTSELRALLQKPLLMDGAAAQVFVDAGLGAKIGIEKVDPFTEGIYEEFTDHALNGSSRSYKRGATIRYFGARSHALTTISGAHVLSTLRAIGGRELGAALSLFQNSTGTPVAVIGHLSWLFALSPQRMEQLQNLSQHMIRLRPVTSARPVDVWWREGADKTLAILFNAGFDDARHLSVPAGGTLALSTPGVVFESEHGSLSLPGWGVAVIQVNSGASSHCEEK